MPARKIVLFFLINLVPASWHLDNGHNDNVMSRAAFVASVVHHGEVNIDRYHESIGDKAFIEGHHYSDKAPLPSLITIPFYWVAFHLGFAGDSSTSISDGLLRVGGLICGSVPFALIVTLIWWMMQKRTSTRSSASVWVMAALYGSFLFVYSGSFQAHLLGGALLLIAALAFERKQYMIAGSFVGGAFLCEYTLLLFAGIWGLQLLFRKELGRALLLGAGVVPVLLFVGWHNNMLTGDPFTFPYKYLVNYPTLSTHYGFRMPTLEALWGLSFSPYRGLLFYAPALVMLIVIGVERIKKAGFNKQWLFDPYLLPSCLLFLVISMHSTWWAGWTYGPRYLTAAAVLLLFVTLTRIRMNGYRPWLLGSLVAFGIFGSFIAKSTLWYDLPTDVQDPLTSKLLPAFIEGNWSIRTGLSELLSAPSSTQAWLFLPIFALGVIFAVKVERQGRTLNNKDRS